MTASHRTRDLLKAALAGVLAAGVTLALAELLAAALVRTGRSGGTPSPVLAVGGAFVDRTPPWLKDWAIGAFGTHDKTALVVGMAAVIAVVAGIAGLLAAWRRSVGLLLVVALAAVAGIAVLSRPHARVVDAMPLVVGTLVGLIVLDRLLDRHQQASSTGHALDRRGFLLFAGGTAAAAALGAVLSRIVDGGSRAVQASRAMVRLPAAARRATDVSTTRSRYLASRRSSPRRTTSTASTPRSWCPRCRRPTGGCGCTAWSTDRSS